MNKVYLINKKEFKQNIKDGKDGILTFEKRNYKIHYHINTILSNILIDDLLCVINDYINEEYNMKYELYWVPCQVLCIKFDMNNDLDFNYRIIYHQNRLLIHYDSYTDIFNNNIIDVKQKQVDYY